MRSQRTYALIPVFKKMPPMWSQVKFGIDLSKIVFCCVHGWICETVVVTFNMLKNNLWCLVMFSSMALWLWWHGSVMAACLFHAYILMKLLRFPYVVTVWAFNLTTPPIRLAISKYILFYRLYYFNRMFCFHYWTHPVVNITYRVYLCLFTDRDWPNL